MDGPSCRPNKGGLGQARRQQEENSMIFPSLPLLSDGILKAYGGIILQLEVNTMV
jgi:hypothetical protein